MRRIFAAPVIGFAAIAGPAHAGDYASYRFKVLVEYGAGGPGTAPMDQSLGSVGIITLKLNKTLTGTFTANTATYRGGYACGPNPSPIASVTATFGTVTFPYLGPGACDQVTIQQNASGVSSITVQNFLQEVGTTFMATFTTTSPGTVTSLAIPDKIDTSGFGRSTFVLEFPSGYMASGDMATR